jgi:hypothetical protein
MAPITSDDDEIRLSGSDLEGVISFIFDLNGRWQSAYLDSLSSLNFNESTSSLSIPAPEDKSSSSLAKDFTKKMIGKPGSFREECQSSPRSKFARSISKSSPNRGKSRLQRPYVPTTVSIVDSKSKA